MAALVALAVLLVLIAQGAAWLAYRNLMLWNPAAAVLAGTEYDEGEREIDAIGSVLIGPLHIDVIDDTYSDYRHVTSYMRFTDHNGVRREATVWEWVRRGLFPTAAMTIWYDPENPERTTQFGPGTYSLVAVAALAALAWLLTRGVGFFV
jgi:hypothetical protein